MRHIVALRGDPPGGPDAPYHPAADGYRTTAELVAGIKAIGDFEVSVAAYPEKHPQSPNLLHDIDLLKRKVDAGADRAITQFFFDNSVYLRFLDVAAAAGLNIPIVPGIVPMQNFKQTAGFAKRTGASVPAWLAERFEGLDDDPVTRRLVAAAVCAEQVVDLIDRGVQDLHFYHDEPRRPRLRDLPFDRPSGARPRTRRPPGRIRLPTARPNQSRSLRRGEVFAEERSLKRTRAREPPGSIS